MDEEEVVKIELEDPSNYHAAKRELFKLGVEKGYLHLQTIRQCLPEQYSTPDEMEIFFFTLEALEIRVIR